MSFMKSSLLNIIKSKKKKFKGSNNEKQTPSSLFIKRRKQPNFILSVITTTIRLFIIFGIVAGFAGFGAVLGVAKAYVDGTPTLDVAKIEDQNETSFFYDSNGKLITEFYGIEHRVMATIDEIPQLMKDAIIAVEDVRFEAHNGVDYKRIFGAFINNLRNESVQGGSTLTQQLIKNTILSPEQTYKRKLQEAYLAIQLEKEYSKDQILEAYLNTIYLGSGNYGIKAAAMDYFDKDDLNDLTLRECAVLAGLTQNPSYFDPRRNIYGTKSLNPRPEVTFRRANLVLRLMYENGFITESEYNSAIFDLDTPEDNEFFVKENSTRQSIYDMPFFIEYAYEELIEIIQKTRGWEGVEGRRLAQNEIRNGGLHIYTTVDPEIQHSVEESIFNHNGYPSTANSSHRVKQSTHGDIVQPQASAIVLDHTTGEIKAVVGGRQNPTIQLGLNRATRDFMPGSSIKPISVYASFIEAGYPGGFILEDIPVPIPGWETHHRGYPENYEGGRHRGPISAKEAITRSLNTATARALSRVGTDYSANKLQEMGVTADHYVTSKHASSLSLGSSALSLMEITGAYATLANKGVYREPTSILKVYDKDGKEIYNNDNQPQRQVFKESTAFIITDWLTSAVSGSGATGGSALFPNMSIAGKTGTNEGRKGVFFAGYTPYYTAVVVIAHDDNESLSKNSTGGAYAAPLWRAIMQPIHKDLPFKKFFDSVPSGVQRVTVCSISGKLPGENCYNHTITEYFPSNAVPKEECDMHVTIEVCKYSGKLPTPYCPDNYRTNNSIIVLPEDSPYHKLSDDMLQKLIPGAFKNMVDFNRLSYVNSDDKEHYCPIHTEEWYKLEQERSPLLTEVQQLISKVKSNINQYKDYLSSNNQKKLEDAIVKLEESLEKGLVDPPDSPDDTTVELPSFNPTKTKELIDELRKMNNEIFDRIKQEIVDNTYPVSPETS